MIKSSEEMTAAQCYKELDRLAEYRRSHGRGRNAGAAHVRHYCKETRQVLKKRLSQLGAPLTRPGDGRVYGPGTAAWQKAAG